MNISEYITAPEDSEGTEKEFMEELDKECEKANEHKKHINQLSKDLFSKPQRTRGIIESLFSQRNEN